jgi:hypothetical protein
MLMERGAFVLMDVAGDTRLAELAQSPREVSTSPSTFSAVLDANSLVGGSAGGGYALVDAHRAATAF